MYNFFVVRVFSENDTTFEPNQMEIEPNCTDKENSQKSLKSFLLRTVHGQKIFLDVKNVCPKNGLNLLSHFDTFCHLFTVINYDK